MSSTADVRNLDWNVGRLGAHIDLTGATDEPPLTAKVSGDQARACFRGLFEVSRHFVNVNVARTCQGVIHIHRTGVDGGDHYTTTLSGDTAITSVGKPERADFHTRAEPQWLLKTSLGRSSSVIAVLTGQILGYGRDPLLGLRSQKLFHQV